MSEQNLSTVIAMKCCGVEPEFKQVFKAAYRGLAFEFKCPTCKHFAASPSLKGAIRAWNVDVSRSTKGLH